MSYFGRIDIYCTIDSKFYWGTFLLSFGFKAFKILRITSFFFLKYDALYFDKICIIFYFMNKSFFVGSIGIYPYIFEYWFTFYLWLGIEIIYFCFGRGKSGKILYFFDEDEDDDSIDMFYYIYFLLNALLGIANSS